jgi:hypothetical protein
MHPESKVEAKGGTGFSDSTFRFRKTSVRLIDQKLW